MQEADVSSDDIYSLIVSVESSYPFYEIYIDAHFHNTALKVIVNWLVSEHIAIMILTLQILKLRRKLNVHGRSYEQFSIRNFRYMYDSTASSEPVLKLIVPEKNPWIIKVQPEDGMVTFHNEYQDIFYSTFHINRLELLTFGGRVSMKTYNIICETFISRWQWEDLGLIHLLSSLKEAPMILRWK